jgi:putative DNA primase/helicase
MYALGRYFTITGNRFPDTPKDVEERKSAIWKVHKTYIATSQSAHPTLSDEQLLTKARKAKNGEKFHRLYDEGNLAEYGDDHSAADLALCGKLNFWTGPDHVRIDRIFRASALMRDKWDERHASDGSTYGQITIGKALSTQPDFGATKPTSASPNCAFDGQAPPKEYLRCTDAAAALWFIKFNGDRVRYVVQERRYYIFDGKRWARDDDEAIYRLAKKLSIDLYSVATQLKDEDEARSKVAWIAVRLESAQNLKKMLESARKDLTIAPNMFDPDHFALNCLNGTVDLRTGALREHSAEDLISKIVPVEYDPHATADRWQRFLHEVFSDDTELLDCVRRAAGYCATGDTREQVIFFLTGTGANGKTTFLETLADVLGDYSARTATETILAKRSGAVPNALAALLGVRLARASETTRGRCLDEAAVKDMTGGDTVPARFLFKEWFSFIPQFKIMLACNHLPKIDGSDKALQRRLRVIPFHVTFGAERLDKYLREHLRDELSGILAWIVRGAVEWQKDGLGTATAMESATESYITANDQFAQFLADMCVVERELTISAKRLRAAFTDWCEDNGLEVPKQSEVTESIKTHGVVKVRNSKGFRLHGLALLADHGEDAKSGTKLF